MNAPKKRLTVKQKIAAAVNQHRKRAKKVDLSPYTMRPPTTLEDVAVALERLATESALARLLGPDSTIYKRLAQIEADVSSGRFDEVHFKGWLDLVFAKQAEQYQQVRTELAELRAAYLALYAQLPSDDPGDVKPLWLRDLHSHMCALEVQTKHVQIVASQLDMPLVWKNVTDLSTSVSKLADEQAVLTQQLEAVGERVAALAIGETKIATGAAALLAMKLDELAAQVRLLTEGRLVPVNVIKLQGDPCCVAYIEKIPSGLPAVLCQLKSGHDGLHNSGSCWWADGGSQPEIPVVNSDHVINPGQVKRAFAPRHDPDAPPR